MGFRAYIAYIAYIVGRWTRVDNPGNEHEDAPTALSSVRMSADDGQTVPRRSEDDRTSAASQPAQTSAEDHIGFHRFFICLYRFL